MKPEAERYLKSKGIGVTKTDQRVGDGKPEFVTRFKSRAERKAASLNASRVFPSYRYEVVREDGKWAVVAMQNVAKMTV
jgi:hypothetical protein